MRVEKKVVYISGIIVAALLAIIWMKCPIIFQNNDDRTLLYFTAGYATGHKEIGSVFGGFFWYGLISFFYKLYEGIAWYTVWQLIAIVVSLVCICIAFAAVTKKNWYIGMTVFVVITLTVLFHFITALQYTVSAGIVGTAAICLYYISLKDNDVLNLWFPLAIVAFIVSFEIRKQMGLVTLSGLGIVFVTSYLNNKKRALKTFIILVCCFVVAFLSNHVYEKISNVADFNEYYKSAGTWNDYPHLEYEGNEDIYEKAGWDETLYNLAGDWYFMDENITTEKFDILNKAYSAQGVSFTEKVDRAKNIIKSSLMSNVQTAILLIVLFVGNIIILIRKKADYRLLGADLLVAIFVVASVHFLLKGRFPLRVYQGLIFTYLIPSLLIILDVLFDDERKFVKGILPVLLMVLPIAMYTKIPDANVIKYTYAVCNDQNRAMDMAQAEILDNYAMTHPKNFYVYDFDLSLPVNPFVTYVNTVPNNLALWGGWQYNTPEYWDQLDENDFTDGFYSENFFDDNVYFCCRELPDNFVSYILKRYPKAKFEQVDECQGIKIYSITK